MNKAIKAIARRIAPWAAGLLLAGCGTLPDAGKLADASVQLRSAVGATGAVVATELRLSGRADTATQFAARWTPAEQASAALVEYAGSLAAIVRSGEQGGESVRKVAAAGMQLMQTVGTVLPPAAAAGAVIDLAAYLRQQVTIAEASRSLEDALVRMQPVVDAIGERMARQLDDAYVVLRSANFDMDKDLREKAQAETGYRRRLAAERTRLFDKDPLTAADEQRLEQLDRLEKIVEARLEPTQKLLDANRLRLRNSAMLVDGAKQAVGDWTLAHRQLLVAVREKRAVDPLALVQSVQELRELVRKAKEAS